ncbi:glycosyltransferase family 41 protein [Polaromonas sp. A23]|uniref:tetratricopeptide repeat protein n=1 Tax=Polaromonas sp. A23 TaxID=1944133 RepID=UPI0009878EF0|nr:glycosyltransferase family 41 protein [Polaromonas sp. A23]OOG48385.1 peptide-binding protein [Polaromonas sp. A23]
MGLFDLFVRSGRPAGGDDAHEMLNSGQSAEQLLEQGMELQQQGQMEKALQCYESAVRLMPELARAHFNRGNILLDRGDAQNALDAFARAVQYKPDSAGAHFNMGAAYVRLDRHEAAVSAYRQALTLKPDFAVAEMALGAALDELGQHEAAIASYRRALAIQADYVEAHHKLVNVLLRLNRLDEVAACYRRMLEFDPKNVELLNNLGLILSDLGHLREAVDCFRRAVQLEPDFVPALGNLGNALMGLRLVGDAMSCYRQVLAIDPGNAEAHNNLGNVFKDFSHLDEALASYRSALTINPDFSCAHSNLLLVHNFLADQSADELLTEARRFGESVARLAPPPVALQNSADAERCLRVGFVSADLRSHPVGFFIEGVLAALSTQAHGRLELYAYSNSPTCDEVTERIKRHLHGWHAVVDEPDPLLAQRIRDDGIDILIDLSGHTGMNRLPLFAWRLAPVQVSWLGYFATTGVAAIDYLIADPWTLPESEEKNFTERILRLPETRLCFTAPTLDLDVGPLPAPSNGYFTFACFNNLAKMNDDVVTLWARILHAVPGSRLHLMAPQLNEDALQRTVVDRFAAVGIDAGRLNMQGSVPRADYLATYQQVDLALDPFPYTGGTTTAEALWMGVPVLTLAGKSFLSRQGVGLLMNAGLPDWIADDTDNYLKRAVSHATDLPRLALLRAGLREQVLSSPVFDAPRFAEHFESGLRGIWQEWCAEQRGPGS